MKNYSFKIKLNPGYRDLDSCPTSWGFCASCGKEMFTNNDTWDVIFGKDQLGKYRDKEDTCSKECAELYVLGNL